MAQKNFIFTVVMPVYNVESYLEEAIESVVKQSIGFEENIQLIFVNDGSTDNSEKICLDYCRRYPGNTVYISKSNGGLCSARNAGFDYIKGSYVNFLDSDDKWETDAFSKALDFFEKHGNEVDLAVGRERIFGLKDRWHAMDFKYKKGTRVIDLTDGKENNCIQVHVNSVFFKIEAIRNQRFDERVRYGEDGLFITPVILEKMKYGIMDDCIYYYRKRLDKSSLTQIQSKDEVYYTTSPELYYNGIIASSIEKNGFVVPYVQNILAYDIGWRVRASVPEDFKKDIAFYGRYLSFLEKTLSFVDDEVFLKSPVHKRIGIKSAFYKLRHPEKELSDTVRMDFKKRSLYSGNVRLYNFSKENHSACVIEKAAIHNGNFEIEGLASKWLLSDCASLKLSLVIRSGNEFFDLNITACDTVTDDSIFGKSERNLRFSAKLDVEVLLENKSEAVLHFAFSSEEKLCDTTVKYCKDFTFSDFSNGAYTLDFTSEGISIKRSGVNY